VLEELRGEQLFDPEKSEEGRKIFPGPASPLDKSSQRPRDIGKNQVTGRGATKKKEKELPLFQGSPRESSEGEKEKPAGKNLGNGELPRSCTLTCIDTSDAERERVKKKKPTAKGGIGPPRRTITSEHESSY